MKVVKVEKIISKESKLPDGIYIGKYGGYSIIIEHEDFKYILTTESGIKGIGYNVIVTVTNGEISYEYSTNKVF